MNRNFLRNIPALERFNMQNNQLIRLEEKTFEFCPKLKEINFGGNSLSFITPSLTNEIKNLKKSFGNGTFVYILYWINIEQ